MASLPRRLLRQYGLVTHDAVLDAMPELELLRQDFQMYANDWLPNWYRSRALEEAVNRQEHSDKIGPAGLELLKSRVEELTGCAREITANHLGDEVWWHYDQGQTQETIIYAVRLCMGWLAVPLRRSGYLNPYAWRELLTVRLDVQTGKKDDDGHPIYEAIRRTRPVPSRRLFCQDECDNDPSCPRFWPEEMTESLTKYFALVEQTQRLLKEQQQERERAREQGKTATVEEILGFQPMPKPPRRTVTPLDLPPPPL